MKLGKSCLMALWLVSSTSSAFTVTKSGTVSHSKLSMTSEEKTESKKSDASTDDFRKGMSLMRGFKKDGTMTDVSMKFGGSSLANADRIDHVTQLIKDQIGVGYRPRAVVCSAMGKTTNSLLSSGDFALDGKVNIDAIRTLHTAALKQFGLEDHVVKEEVRELLDECQDMLNGVRLLQELSPKSLDQLVSYGERCSVRIVAARLNQIGVPAQAFDAWDVGMYTDSNFGDAALLKNNDESIQLAFERIDPSIVAVVTGFIGHDPNKKITTLGRGGSDLTCTAIGSALKLDEIQVWKDVDGILSADPRLVSTAVPVYDVSYEEAAELAYFGAQVLHPIAMQPAMKSNVPVRVKNSYNPSAEGTVIAKRTGPAPYLVTAITCKRNVQLLDIQSTQMLGAYGFLSTVFSDLEKHKLSVDVLASSEVSISLTLDKKQTQAQIDDAINVLQPYADVQLKSDRAILTLITDVQRSSEVLATVFRVFASQNIDVEMMSQGASKVNISFVLKTSQIDRAILNLHSCFFEDMCVITPYQPDEETMDEKLIIDETKP
uniref:Aspartokinase n=1 Tax=Eucampia antarctica TaxID=49252 RepID=A0A7S2WA47_9STRA|mmetsp:Transcript_24329/g.23383  ORF Transcript_24329/g.23383 Transcript_24329/m.23383 type:complete len:546 (+) Transcript_24329:67-1704(+)|eukprot:CAMPEP_0197824634 /NCGR_PEP_ID=MMETSP1437-20131217/1853_1 /TAXON_ID=49252 ORGANISM="Eucampia antarctica, Strain CCMP1452" /NCGR_SAMPLE_ID=MMETSP1437 /ASSEMBLY_ACC=CAM_ASM_001096 /LENGTH=545 /DNA_ID=CAMNT_0043424337 /DNA_START=65 /DNA_END=1702 /DNA_ORIENTATION=-